VYRVENDYGAGIGNVVHRGSGGGTPGGVEAQLYRMVAIVGALVIPVVAV
jgi:hypothetical protein